MNMTGTIHGRFTNDHGNRVTYRIVATLTHRDCGPVLSVVGETWENGQWSSGGQCYDDLADAAPNAVELWQRWHLNDMRSGCEHQRQECDQTALLTLTPLTWGPRYHELRRLALAGTMAQEDAATWADTVATVERLTIKWPYPCHPQAWGEAGENALAAELVAIGPAKTRPACNTFVTEHPDGLLGRVCPECGHRYGHGWVYEPIPDDALADIVATFNMTVDTKGGE